MAMEATAACLLKRVLGQESNDGRVGDHPRALVGPGPTGMSSAASPHPHMAARSHDARAELANVDPYCIAARVII